MTLCLSFCVTILLSVFSAIARKIRVETLICTIIQGKYLTDEVDSSTHLTLLAAASAVPIYEVGFHKLRVDFKRSFLNFYTIMPLPPHVNFLNQGNVEPMQVDDTCEENENVEIPCHVVDNASLDLELYASQYSGFAKLDRLLYIADHCPPLRADALKMMLNHLEQTCNTAKYTEIHQKLQDISSHNSVLPDAIAEVIASATPLDKVWVDDRQKKAALMLERLDTDLKNYKSNSIKESIRRGQDDLGDHYLDCGDLTNALKCYSRARDYCTSAKHVINMCLNVIKVSVYLQNWSHVLSYCNKAESTPEHYQSSNKEKDLTPFVATKLKCAAGLAELVTGKYKNAARNFLHASFDHSDFPDLMSPGNVAMYGGLCALASYDRQELQKNVISSSAFKQFLELEPPLRDMIHAFYDSRYGTCLRLLDSFRDQLLLDMYLAPHVEKLYTQIRNRALIQYFSPYLSADMQKMAVSFNTNIECLEDELMQLILDGQINARIDSHNRILYAKDTDQRSTTFSKALAMGKLYQKRTNALILRCAVLKNQIQVKEPNTNAATLPKVVTSGNGDGMAMESGAAGPSSAEASTSSSIPTSKC